MKAFFVSYTSADKAWAEWISWQLEEVGYTCVVQAWDFRPGMNFVLAMQQAATESERTIAVLSAASLLAKYTQSEWASAFATDPTGDQGYLVPVRVEEVEPSGIWKPIVYIDLVGLSEADARTALIEGIRRDRRKPTVPPPFPPKPLPIGTDLMDAPAYPRPDIVVSDTDERYAELRVELHQDDKFRTAFREAGTRITRSTSDAVNDDIFNTIRSTIADEENSTTSREPETSLFSVLVPPAQRDNLSRESGVILRSDSHTAWLPWELILCPHMAKNVDNNEEIGTVIRQQRLPTPTQRILTTQNRKALVIGLTVGRESFVKAESVIEAYAVSTQFRDFGIPCDDPVVQCTAQNVLCYLHRAPYTMLHIAGDAVLSSGRTGIGLSSGVILTPEDIEQMRWVPEIIFLNVRGIYTLSDTSSAVQEYSIGRQQITRGMVAANMALKLHSMGIPMVVVTGWTINEDACRTWISTFYSNLLSGQTFGVSTKQAQASTFAKHKDVNTWGAFHCYGDPRSELESGRSCEIASML